MKIVDDRCWVGCKLNLDIFSKQINININKQLICKVYVEKLTSTDANINHHFKLTKSTPGWTNKQNRKYAKLKVTKRQKKENDDLQV